MVIDIIIITVLLLLIVWAGYHAIKCLVEEAKNPQPPKPKPKRSKPRTLEPPLHGLPWMDPTYQKRKKRLNRKASNYFKY